jgi:oxygen-independent coproporphyrinogen-3 oxidase
MNYWKRGEYLGLGPGAWSFISGKRYANFSDVREYGRRLAAGSNAVEYEETMLPEQAAAEAVMLGLRTDAGIDMSWFAQEHGSHAAQRLAKNRERLDNRGLLFSSPERLRLTDRGILLSDDVIGRLFP